MKTPAEMANEIKRLADAMLQHSRNRGGVIEPRESDETALHAAIAELEAMAEGVREEPPAGWVMVPRVATDDMLIHGQDAVMCVDPRSPMEDCEAPAATWAAMIAAAPPAPEGRVPQWQPIATAPKDGTWMHAWRAHDTLSELVRYNADLGEFENWSGFLTYQLTHWQPLPTQPAGTTNEGA